MPDLVPDLNGPQRFVLETLYGVFRQSTHWPTFQYVAGVLDDAGLDAQRVLESMPPGLYWPRDPASGVIWHREDDRLGLRVRGLACCSDSETDLRCFLAVIRFIVEEWRAAKPESPQSVVEPILPVVTFIKPIKSVVGPNPELYRVLLVLELMQVEPHLPSSEGSVEDRLQRHVRLSRALLRYRDVETIDDFLAALPAEWPSHPAHSERAGAVLSGEDNVAPPPDTPQRNGGDVQSETAAVRRLLTRWRLLLVICAIGLIATIVGVVAAPTTGDKLGVGFVGAVITALIAIAVATTTRRTAPGVLPALIVGIVAAVGAAPSLAEWAERWLDGNEAPTPQSSAPMTDAVIRSQASARGLTRIANCRIDFHGGGERARIMLFRPRSVLSELSDEVQIYEEIERGFRATTSFRYRPQPVTLAPPLRSVGRLKAALAAEVRVIGELDGATGSEAIIDFYETAHERGAVLPLYLNWDNVEQRYRIRPLLSPQTTGRASMRSVVTRRYSRERDFVREIFRWVYNEPVELIDGTDENPPIRSFAVQGYAPAEARAPDPRAVRGGAISIFAGYFIRGRSTGDVDLLQVVPWTIDLRVEGLEAEGYGTPLLRVPYDRGRPVANQLVEFIQREGRARPIPRPNC